MTIETNANGGWTVTDPANDLTFQAITFRFHCRIAAAGMTSRGITRTRLLKLAGSITGKTYKRGQFKLAAQDLGDWLEVNRC